LLLADFLQNKNNSFSLEIRNRALKWIHNNTDTDSSIGNGETEISTVENGLLYDSPDRTAHLTSHEICSRRQKIQTGA
jgi:hypothetical protein